MKNPMVIDIGGRKVPLKMKPFEEDDDVKYSIEEFIQCVKSGLFINYDGYGVYATSKEKSNKVVRPSDIKKGKIDKSFTHVVWYNR